MHEDELQLLRDKLAQEYQWQDDLRRSVEHNNAVIERLQIQLGEKICQTVRSYPQTT